MRNHVPLHKTANAVSERVDNDLASGAAEEMHTIREFQKLDAQTLRPPRA